MPKEHLKTKYVFYFLFGLLLNILALTVGCIWIKWRVKTARKAKFISLLLGVLLSLSFVIISRTNMYTQWSKNSLFSIFPEVRKVDEALNAKYPDFTITESTSWVKHANTGITTRSLAINMSSRKDLTQTKEEMGEITKSACIILHEQGKDYDNVAVRFIKDNTILGLVGATQSKFVNDDCKGYY
jgi:hypothetical protein